MDFRTSHLVACGLAATALVGVWLLIPGCAAIHKPVSATAIQSAARAPAVAVTPQDVPLTANPRVQLINNLNRAGVLVMQSEYLETNHADPTEDLNRARARFESESAAFRALCSALLQLDATVSCPQEPVGP